MSVINFRDKKIEIIGQEIGDGYILLGKMYFASIDALRDIAKMMNDERVNDRIVKLNEELTQLEAFYINLNKDNESC